MKVIRQGVTEDFKVPKHQPDGTLDQANPIQNTWYTVLDTKRNVGLYGIGTKVLVADETLEVRITIDGQTLTGSVSATTDTWYVWHINLTAGGLQSETTLDKWKNAGLEDCLSGRSVKVEVRKTTALGAGNLQARVVWAKIG